MQCGKNQIPSANHINKTDIQTSIWCAVDRTDPPHHYKCHFDGKNDKNSVPQPKVAPTLPGSLLQVKACSTAPANQTRCSAIAEGPRCMVRYSFRQK